MLQQVQAAISTGVPEVYQVVIGFLVLLVTYWLVLRSHDRRRLPPGPFPWPVVGNYFYIRRHAHTAVVELSKRYGPVLTLHIGGHPIVFLSGYQAIYEALVKKVGVFNGRATPNLEFVNNAERPGIFEKTGESWKIHRLIAKKALTKFAPTPETKEKIFKDEISHFLCAVTKTNGKPFCPDFLTVAATQNLMFRFVVGKRIEYHDDSYLRFVNDFIYLGRALTHLDLPFLRPKEVNTRTTSFKKYSTGKIRERLQEVKKLTSGTKCCYVDTLHSEFQSQEVAMDTLEFDEADLVADAFTPFVATSDATILQWAMYFMIKYPDVQTHVQEELDRVVGPDRLPSLFDQNKLPWTQAALLESQRFSGPIAFPPEHVTLKDTEISGRSIPKGTRVIPNIWSALNDPEYWREPERFDPSRFLNESNEVVIPAAFIPFSIGLRKCIGQYISKEAMFLFFASILHQFTLNTPENGKPLNDKNVVSGLAIYRESFELCAVKRV